MSAHGLAILRSSCVARSCERAEGRGCERRRGRSADRAPRRRKSRPAAPRMWPSATSWCVRDGLRPRVQRYAEATTRISSSVRPWRIPGTSRAGHRREANLECGAKDPGSGRSGTKRASIPRIPRRFRRRIPFDAGSSWRAVPHLLSCAPVLAGIVSRLSVLLRRPPDGLPAIHQQWRSYVCRGDPTYGRVWHRTLGDVSHKTHY